MSFNNLIYDNCAYKQALHQSVGTLAYQLDPNRYENCNKCRIEFGLVGGTAVSHVQGNMVDLESELRGQTYLASKCPSLKYQNPCPKGDINTCKPGNIKIRQTPSTRGREINTNMVHLPSCQMHRFRPVPLPPAIPYYTCPK